VRASSDHPDLIPEIRELIETSGHRTFRLFFKEAIDRERQQQVIEEFRELHVTYERANGIYVALDMAPEGNYQAIFDKLEEYADQEILGFETCE
jgi:ribosome maturation protein Sdo1